MRSVFALWTMSRAKLLKVVRAVEKEKRGDSRPITPAEQRWDSDSGRLPSLMDRGSLLTLIGFM